MVLRHVAPILLGSAFLGMEEGRAVFLGRISLNSLILKLLFVKTFALNFTQSKPLYCVYLIYALPKACREHIYEREQQGQDKGMKISQLCFPILGPLLFFETWRQNTPFVLALSILFEMMWNNAPSYSHSLSQTSIFYVQATTWQHLHLSVSRASLTVRITFS